LDRLFYAAIGICCFIPAIVVHELSHGYAALQMGDTTAKDAKRLTLNPLAHIDLFGTVILPLMLVAVGLPAFGYAKPVPYNPRRFKNIKVGELVVGLAGPASNLVMALVSTLIAFCVWQIPTWNEAIRWVYTILYNFTMINLCLMFFNLLPIPPLDGSSIIVPLLPAKALPRWYQFQRQAMPLLVILIVVVPYITGMFGYRLDLLQMYIEATAGNLIDILYSFH
jgi:Zn-dependent protease